MKDWIDLINAIAWPLVVGLVVWKLLPTIRKMIDSRAFSVKVAGFELSAQDASDKLGHNVEDLREQLSALKAQVEAGSGGAVQSGASPIADGLATLRSLLWVDDYPQNNAFEVESLRRKDVRVEQLLSTKDGLRRLDKGPPVDAVITDMSRQEDGADNTRAGLDLLTGVRDRKLAVPVLVYASATAVARTREEAMELGATIVTSSATELLDALGRVGQA